MGISSKARLTEQRARIARFVEKQAFDSYLRRGRVLGLQTQLDAATRQLSLKALGDTRPTMHYTWRTARDERVRSAHAANDGRVFSWSSPPKTGHPGHAYHCRCWAEPYYGTPMVPDTTLMLRRQLQVDTTGGERWASIETHTRPDGSLARSTVSIRDGVRVLSTFVGSNVTHNVRLPSGQSVRVERRNAFQSVFSDGASLPVLRSIWTPDGPKVAIRHHTAQGPASPTFGQGNEFDDRAHRSVPSWHPSG